MKKYFGVAVALSVLAASAWAAGPAAPTFQELMEPTWFPEAQRGMQVESVQRDGDAIRIRTTGAEMTVDVARGEVRFDQRIGHPRPVAVLHLGKPLEGATVTHSGPGLARITFERPAMTVRVNGDSLFMVHVRDPLTLSVERKIEPGWNASFLNNHLVADEWGAFGLYCSARDLADGFDALAGIVATYPLPGDGVLWVGVCPPKQYDWERSLKDNVAWHWSDKLAYPPDAELRSWKPYGTIVLLQSELLLWKDWNLDFVPRLGPEEFARVRKTIHDSGMRFIVYTSPYYFLKGTALEPKAINTFDGFKGWPPGTPTGENMGLFLDAIRRVMADSKPDGLYFDGQYIDNPAALYALAREARRIVGTDGILEWHSTWALGPNHCYVPQADAYVDFILRGEGQGGAYTDVDYLRFFVSGYNINNCLGALCNNGPPGLTPDLVRNVLRVNGRFHTIVSWLDKPDLMQIWKDDYQAKLTPELRESVDREMDARQAEVARKAQATRAELEALAKAPAWGAAAFSLRFDKLPDAEQHVSPANSGPFSAKDGALHVQARANTFAYFRVPLETKAGGFVVKIRQGADGGMSWGPAAMLRWSGGKGLRIGTRADGTLQADILGAQWHGGVYDVNQWVWLRARWLGRHGVIERSSDGVTYERVWGFDCAGELTGPTVDLLVGKVAYDGQPQDFTELGAPGACDLALVEVYAAK